MPVVPRSCDNTGYGLCCHQLCAFHGKPDQGTDQQAQCHIEQCALPHLMGTKEHTLALVCPVARLSLQVTAVTADSSALDRCRLGHVHQDTTKTSVGQPPHVQDAWDRCPVGQQEAIGDRQVHTCSRVHGRLYGER
jgi:hypothetical protein